MLINDRVTAGQPITINVAQSAFEPALTLCLLTISPFQTPSVVPGVVSLEIGAGFTALIQFPNLNFNASTQTLTFPSPTLPAHAGLALWLEAIYLRNPLPLPTTNAVKVVIQ